MHNFVRADEALHLLEGLDNFWVGFFDSETFEVGNRLNKDAAFVYGARKSSVLVYEPSLQAHAVIVLTECGSAVDNPGTGVIRDVLIYQDSERSVRFMLLGDRKLKCNGLNNAGWTHLLIIFEERDIFYASQFCSFHLL